MSVSSTKEYDEKIFEAIFKSCEEGIIVANILGEITMANGAAHGIFGYDDNELLQNRIEDLIPSKKRKDHKQIRGTYHQNPSPRKMGKGRDLLGLKKDGKEFPVEICLSTVKIKGINHALAFITDIHERKKMELELQNSQGQLLIYANELEQRVESRTIQLDTNMKELERLNKALSSQIEVTKKAEAFAKSALEKEKELSELKSRFVSMASHEFRTPLSTILSSAALIAKYKTEETNDKRVRHVDKIKLSINNLNHILNDFLSISKLEEGKIQIDYVQMDLQDLVGEVLEEFSTIVKEGQKFVVEMQGAVRSILMDRKILKNVLINLLSNATKYSAKNKNIYLTVNYHPKNTTIEVKDEGIGISDEDQKHLFERFFRAKNAINIQGTGLGLNIVKIYMKELNGSVMFKSELGIGTSFTLNLPA